MSFFKIKLESLRFYSKIGVLEQERKVGNEFIVDICVFIPADKFIEEDISTSVNYAVIYDIIENVMGEELLLLETAASRTEKRIRETFPSAGEIRVNIAKVNPPIPGVQGCAAVEYVSFC